MKKILKNKKILFLSLGAAVVGASVVAIAASCAAAGHSASSVQYKQNKLAITLAEKVEKAVGDELAKEKFTVTVVKTKEDGSQESVVIANSAGSYLEEVNMVVVDATPNTSIAEGDRVIVSSKSVKATFTVDKQFAGKYEAAASSSNTPAQEAVVVSTVSVDVTNTDPVVTLTFAADIPANMEVKLKVAKKDGTNEKEMPATVSTTNKKQATVTLSGLEAATEYKVTAVMVATKTATLPTTGLNFTTKAAAATPAPNTGSDTSGSTSGGAGSSGATTGGSDNTSGSSTPATGTGA